MSSFCFGDVPNKVFSILIKICEQIKAAACGKSLAAFAHKGAKKLKSVFSRIVYAAQTTSRPARGDFSSTIFCLSYKTGPEIRLYLRAGIFNGSGLHSSGIRKPAYSFFSRAAVSFQHLINMISTKIMQKISTTEPTRYRRARLTKPLSLRNWKNVM